jgi:hypothetical protein
MAGESLTLERSTLRTIEENAMVQDPDDTPRPEDRPGRNDGPGSADAPRPPPRRPYPVDDPGLTDPSRTPGAEPDYLPGTPTLPGTRF